MNKKKFNRVVRKLYLVDKIIGKINLYRLRYNKPVIIYQMGKVASQSIAKSLRRYFPLVFNMHEISNHSSNSNSRLLFEHLLKREPTFIISIVRDPIARNISSFFQNIDLFCPQYECLSVEEVIKIYFKKYHHVYPIFWFDWEMLLNTGIDVYDYEYNHIHKHMIIQSGEISVLVLRAEDSDSCKEKSISTYFESDISISKQENITDKTELGDLYKEFKQKICFDNVYLEKMYQSRMVRKFYTSEEIEGFYARWNK